MRLLMPSHVNSVQLYRDTQPVFAKAGVEAQLDAMFSNQVTLKSGGYIVINQTEALVAIDVNSGRSTREHNIEDTALCAPISRPPTRSRASCGCATSPASSSSTSSTWRSRATIARSSDGSRTR